MLQRMPCYPEGLPAYAEVTYKCMKGESIPVPTCMSVQISKIYMFTYKRHQEKKALLDSNAVNLPEIFLDMPQNVYSGYCRASYRKLC